MYELFTLGGGVYLVDLLNAVAAITGGGAYLAGVNGDAGTVNLQRKDGEIVGWVPHRLAARTGGAEVYRCESFELRAGDRIRWTRNDKALGLINSQTAEVTRVRKGTVTLALEDGRRLKLREGDAQLRHIDRAWASTVHAFQGRTVDTVIAAMEANHPHLTTQKTLYVEISRARHRAELVTNDREALGERLQTVTGERISALEAVKLERGKVVEIASKDRNVPDCETATRMTREGMLQLEKMRERREIEIET